MTAGLQPHLDHAAAAITAAEAAPLSMRKARLAALLLDDCADRIFAATATGGDDILAWRDGRAARSPALAAIFALADGRAVLALDTVAVDLADYPALPLADFMVSLYNDHTVQRVRLVLPDGRHLDLHALLRSAFADLREGAARAP